MHDEPFRGFVDGQYASVNGHSISLEQEFTASDARQRHTPLDTAKVWGLRLRNNR